MKQSVTNEMKQEKKHEMNKLTYFYMKKSFCMSDN